MSKPKASQTPEPSAAHVGDGDKKPVESTELTAAAQKSKRLTHAILTFDVPTYCVPTTNDGNRYTTSQDATRAVRNALLSTVQASMQVDPAIQLRTHKCSHGFGDLNPTFDRDNTVPSLVRSLMINGPRLDLPSVRMALFEGSVACVLTISKLESEEGDFTASANLALQKVEPPFVVCYTLKAGMHKSMYTTMYKHNFAVRDQGRAARYQRLDDATYVRGQTGTNGKTAVDLVNDFVGELNARRPEGTDGTVVFLNIDRGYRLVHNDEDGTMVPAFAQGVREEVINGDGGKLYYN